MPVKDKRTNILRVRLNGTERAKLDRKAKARGMDTSTWARKLLLAQ